MTYEETIDYLYGQLPMFSRIGAAALKPNLNNTLALLEALGNPHHHLQTIHIAGTNGKGSTSHMLASVFQSAGYKTGLYTSPHLVDFRERIRINGQMIEKEEVVSFVSKHKDLFEKVQPSFFEWTVALCFDYFNKQQTSIAIIETGLGGRLDSTNVLNPLLSVITNISWDHMDLLGDTLEKIAFEKAGIIKPNTPALIGESLPETKNVFTEKAKSEHAPLYFSEDLISVSNFHTDSFIAMIDVEVQTEPMRKLSISCDLPGSYQALNLRTVIAATEIINRELNFQLTDKDLMHGLSNVQHQTGLMGRWQVLGSKPLIVCDTAHNIAGIELMVQQIKTQQFETLRIIFGMVKDKDITKILSKLPKNAIYYFCKANLPRSLDAEVLQSEAAGFGLRGKTYSSVNEAIKFAKEEASVNDLIFIGGSNFIVGEALQIFEGAIH